MTAFYEYKDDSWYDLDSDTLFEAYNAVGWEQNGTAHSLHELYSQVLYYHNKLKGLHAHPFSDYTLKELEWELGRAGIVLEEVYDEC